MKDESMAAKQKAIEAVEQTPEFTAYVDVLRQTGALDRQLMRDYPDAKQMENYPAGILERWNALNDRRDQTFRDLRSCCYKHTCSTSSIIKSAHEISAL